MPDHVLNALPQHFLLALKWWGRIVGMATDPRSHHRHDPHGRIAYISVSSFPSLRYYAFDTHMEAIHETRCQIPCQSTYAA